MLWDMCHNLFIGVGRDLCGGAIVRLLELRYYSSTSDCTDTHLKLLSARCREWCLETKVGVHPPVLNQYSLGLPAELSKMKTKLFPELDAKAAHVKLYLMFLASEIFIASLCGDPELKIIAACLYYVAAFIADLNTCGMLLSEAKAGVAKLNGQRFLVLYRYLARFTMQRNLFRYRLRPKVHYLHHAVLQLDHWRLNPMLATCFLDEDFMGKVKSISSKCHKRTVCRRTLNRYVVMMRHRWRRLRKRIRKSK